MMKILIFIIYKRFFYIMYMYVGDIQVKINYKKFPSSHTKNHSFIFSEFTFLWPFFWTFIVIAVIVSRTPGTCLRSAITLCMREKSFISMYVCVWEKIFFLRPWTHRLISTIHFSRFSWRFQDFSLLFLRILIQIMFILGFIITKISL